MMKTEFEDERFRHLSTEAQLFFLQASRQVTMPNWIAQDRYTTLGIVQISIRKLAAQAGKSIDQYYKAFHELETKGFARYDTATHTLWLCIYLDFQPKPYTHERFAKQLRVYFARIPWSPVKRECARDLYKRSYYWGLEYHAVAKQILIQMFPKTLSMRSNVVRRNFNIVGTK